MASPASATNGDSGTVDTNSSSVYTQPGGTPGNGGDECAGDKCKKIPWCDDKGNAKPLSSDAPTVYTDGDKPTCIKKPKIEYKCCVADKGGTAKVVVTVTNPNKHMFKVRVWLDESAPEVKWVDGNSTATFRFKDVANGDHKLQAAVWAGGDAWCKFGHQKITVKCATPSTSSSPSASPSTSHSHSPSPGMTTTPVSNPGGGSTLPVTGVPIGLLVAGGLAAVVVGGLLIRRWRNRVQFTA